MNAMARRALPWVGAVALGALAYLLLGVAPRSAMQDHAAQTEWSLPSPVGNDIAAADAAWQMRAPWGAPTRADSGEAPSLPPPVPVAIAEAGGAFEAVFVVPGGGEVRVKAGDPLPGGGEVTTISRFHVGWTDAQGAQQKQEFFGDPLRPLTIGSGP